MIARYRKYAFQLGQLVVYQRRKQSTDRARDTEEHTMSIGRHRRTRGAYEEISTT
jgi:hypothetical protein